MYLIFLVLVCVRLASDPLHAKGKRAALQSIWMGSLRSRGFRCELPTNQQHLTHLVAALWRLPLMSFPFPTGLSFWQSFAYWGGVVFWIRNVKLNRRYAGNFNMIWIMLTLSFHWFISQISINRGNPAEWGSEDVFHFNFFLREKKNKYNNYFTPSGHKMVNCMIAAVKLYSLLFF